MSQISTPTNAADAGLAIAHALELEGIPSGRSVWFLSAEAIAVFKLLFYRPKDIADLERMSAVQGPALQRDYVRTWIVDMLGPDDERVKTWDRISEI